MELKGQRETLVSLETPEILDAKDSLERKEKRGKLDHQETGDLMDLQEWVVDLEMLEIGDLMGHLVLLVLPETVETMGTLGLQDHEDQMDLMALREHVVLLAPLALRVRKVTMEMMEAMELLEAMETMATLGHRDILEHQVHLDLKAPSATLASRVRLESLGRLDPGDSQGLRDLQDRTGQRDQKEMRENEDQMASRDTREPQDPLGTKATPGLRAHRDPTAHGAPRVHLDTMEQMGSLVSMERRGQKVTRERRELKVLQGLTARRAIQDDQVGQAGLDLEGPMERGELRETLAFRDSLEWLELKGDQDQLDQLDLEVCQELMEHLDFLDLKGLVAGMDSQEVQEALVPLDLRESLVSLDPRARLDLPESLESQVTQEKPVLPVLMVLLETLVPVVPLGVLDQMAPRAVGDPRVLLVQLETLDPMACLDFLALKAVLVQLAIQVWREPQVLLESLGPSVLKDQQDLREAMGHVELRGPAVPLVCQDRLEMSGFVDHLALLENPAL